jgi:hypothetical protein
MSCGNFEFSFQLGDGLGTGLERREKIRRVPGLDLEGRR